MNKKGNVLMVSVLFIIILTLFAIINMVNYNMFSWVDDSILEDLQQNTSKQVITDVTTDYPSVFDGVILIIFAGLWVGGIASGIMREEHPLLFGFMMLMVIAVIIAGAFLSNSYEEMFQDAEYSGMTTTFPKTHWIMTHLLELGILMALSALLAVMAKNKL